DDQLQHMRAGRVGHVRCAHPCQYRAGGGVREAEQAAEELPFGVGDRCGIHPDRTSKTNTVCIYSGSGSASDLVAIEWFSTAGLTCPAHSVCTAVMAWK